jgi:hypothetical protein
LFRVIPFTLISSASLVAAPQPQLFRRPLVFEPNRGQVPAQVKWLARGPGYQLLITSEGVTMIIQEGVARLSASAAKDSQQSPGPELSKLRYSKVEIN